MAMGPVAAYILITVPAKKSGDLVETLWSTFPDVVLEAAAVYGEADVWAKVEAPSIDDLHNLVMEKIQNRPNVTVTRTFIIIPHLHRTR